MANVNLSRRQFLAATLAASLGIPNLFNHLPARAQDRKIRAAVTTAGMAGTWNQQGKEAAELFAEWLGIEMVWYDGKWDVPTQLDAMTDIAKQQWDFVAVQPNSIGALIEPLQQVIKAGIPVIDMDTLIAPLPILKQMGVLTFIAPDNVGLAEAVVQKLVDSMGGKGKIAQTWGQQGHTGAQGRAQGFYNIIKKYPDIEVVDDQPADWLVDRTAEIWQVLLKRHPDLKAGFLHNDDMALAARGVVEQAGLQDQIVLAGIDAMIPALDAVKQGKLLATARNSATRIHAWGIMAGYYAATVGVEKARQTIPPFILADGAVVAVDTNTDADLLDEPWKLRTYGQNVIDGYIWAEQQLVF
jgi:ribose transport system substrate-binding protein